MAIMQVNLLAGIHGYELKDLIWQSFNVHMLTETRSHPEMVGDMLRVTLNFDLSKIPFVHF